jgi:hypothetical protein
MKRNQITPISLQAIFAASVGLALGACDLFTRTEIDATPNETTRLHLVRAMQTVRRIDCSGHIYSEHEEEVIKANALVEIRPKMSTSQIYDSHFYNRRTGQSARATRGYIGFYVDISANSALGMHVAEGINEIEYKYTECLKFMTSSSPNGSLVCLDERTLEEGKILLDVSYELKNFEAIEEIRDLCQP